MTVTVALATHWDQGLHDHRAVCACLSWVFNIVGGIALVTELRIVRTKELVAHWRRQSPAGADALHDR